MTIIMDFFDFSGSLYRLFHPNADGNVRGDPIPEVDTNPGQTREMSYQNWAEQPARIVQMRHKFCPMSDFLDFVETSHGAGFFVHASRLNIISQAQELRGPAPFAEKVRFPADVEYVDLDHKTIRPHIAQLVDSCELPDRQLNASANGHSSSSLSDAKRSFDVALRKLRDIAKETDMQQLPKKGVFTRETFEATYALQWA